VRKVTRRTVQHWCGGCGQQLNEEDFPDIIETLASDDENQDETGDPIGGNSVAMLPFNGSKAAPTAAENQAEPGSVAPEDVPEHQDGTGMLKATENHALWSTEQATIIKKPLVPAPAANTTSVLTEYARRASDLTPRITGEKVRFVLAKLAERGPDWAYSYMSRVEGFDRWPAHVREAVILAAKGTTR
jgi:hypothetical protein